MIGFLVGQVMQKSKGKANPQMANEMLKTVEDITKALKKQHQQEKFSLPRFQ